MEVYADGERVGPLPGTMEAVRDALTVRVPAHPDPLERANPSGGAVSPDAFNASSSVTGGPVTWTVPCMPAASWPGIVQ